VGGRILTGLNLTSTVHTNAGTYSDTWTFTNANYNDATGTVTNTIAKANATITVTGYNTTYNAVAQQATGIVTGVGGRILTGLNLTSTTHTNAGTYTDTWTFTNANYNDASGTVTSTIAKANAVISVTGYTLTYDGLRHLATGTAKGVTGLLIGGLNLSSTAHGLVGVYNDTWIFTDTTGNYNNASGTVVNTILPRV
jgi:hypothetical protein